MTRNEIQRLLRRSKSNLRFHEEDAARLHVDAVVRRARPPCPLCGRAARWPTSTTPAKGRCMNHGWFGYRQNTMLEKSHLPLRHWLAAIRLAVASRGRVTAAELNRVLDLRSFHTAQRLAAKVCEEWTAFAHGARSEEVQGFRSGEANKATWINAAESQVGSSDFEKVSKGQHLGIEGPSWLEDADASEDLAEDFASELRDKVADQWDEDADDEHLDAHGLPVDYDDIEEAMAGSERIAVGLNDHGFRDGVQALFAYEEIRVARFSLKSTKFTDDDERGSDLVTHCDAAKILDLSILQTIALSRLQGASKFSEVRNDRIMFNRTKLEVGRVLFRNYAAHSLPSLSRVVSAPLPPLLWKSLRKLSVPLGRAGDVTDDRYKFLYDFWFEIDFAYEKHGDANNKWRRSRQGLHWALIETTDLTSDRCYRYARAIEMVVNTPTYDGSSRAFAEILSAGGGLDRTIRLAGAMIAGRSAAKRRSSERSSRCR